MLYGLLPLLRGWMYVHREKQGYLTLGKEEVIDVIKAPGFFLSAGGLLEESRDAKYVHIHVEIDGPDRAYPIDFMPYGLYRFGLVSPMNFGAYLTIYDDDKKQYAAALTPSHPIPFSKRFEVKLIAPPQPIEETEALPIRYHVAYEVVRITDVEEFKESVREVLGTRRAEVLPGVGGRTESF